MAFDSGLEIDEENYRRHLRYLVDTPGVAGITTNAHASEVATLTFEEQQRVLEMTLDEVAGAVPVRSEEHTSELQSRQYLVCRLLLEKKKKLYRPILRSHFLSLL